MYLLDVQTHNGLPLLSELHKIEQIAEAFDVDNPYEFTGCGCSKRADCAIHQFNVAGLLIKAMGYGMIIEPDMSKETLQQQDPNQRHQALKAYNPLYDMIDFGDAELLEKIEASGATVDRDKRTIELPPYFTGKYALSTDEIVSYNFARSHIFPVFEFWDQDSGQIVKKGYDPAVSETCFFDLEDLPGHFQSPDAVLFTSKVGERFDVERAAFSEAQQERFLEILDSRDWNSLSDQDRHGIIRRFLKNAPKGTEGDPETWADNNNAKDENLGYAQDDDLGSQFDVDLDQPLAEREKETLVRERAQSSFRYLELLRNLVNVIHTHKSEKALRAVPRQHKLDRW